MTGMTNLGKIQKLGEVGEWPIFEISISVKCRRCLNSLTLPKPLL